MTTTVLGYSGGLDTSVSIRWLRDTYATDVICVLVDVGQPLSNLQDAIDRGKANGAKEVVVVDAKEEFASDFVLPALKANALYEGVYPLATALARPLIAKKMVEVAGKVGASAIAHGCTPKGNDQVRFEVAIRALAPELQVIAPLREWKTTRENEIAYAKKHGIQLPPEVKASTFSVDENLWGRSIEAGSLEDPAAPVPEAAFAWTKSPQAAPAAPETLTIAFERGLPIAANGKRLPLVELIRYVHEVAGAHGIGRIDHVENRVVGIKSREVYEAPAAITLLQAHQAIEALTLSRDVAHFKPILESKIAELAYDGLWFSPLREAASAFVETVQQDVTGEVTLSLYKGAITFAGRRSPVSMYRTALASYETGTEYKSESAAGFIDLFSLPLAVRAATRRRKG